MSLLKPALKLMRPSQWIKNGFVLMPLIFSGRLYSRDDAFQVAGMLAAFCLASSATYVLNDYMDRDQDRVHPLKKHRPLASGDISPSVALFMMACLVGGVFGVAALGRAPLEGFLFLSLYMVLQILYSVWLKHVLIVDVLTISTGFLLRVLGGAVVINVPVSSWLLLCTFSVAILLALGKRRHEIMILSDEACSHRRVLGGYNVPLLDQLLQVVTTSTFIFYCLYSVHGNPAVGIESQRLMLTIPLVTYGLFRYMYLIYCKEDGGSPAALLLTDPPLLTCILLWLIGCVAIIYL